ncbi:hypothetical protein G6F37_009612 [Rhizopus arrhizus]|nr:hypothetical protein G6F38_009840 [Rhizopus arrhizus]KAG1154258.1 hypothetical protein G6F37_009612 [Rhizopus arrhizus]
MVIYKSSLPPVTIPKTDIYTFVTTPNDFHQNKDLNEPVVIHGETGQGLSWNQVKHDSSLLASGWKENVGLKEGETVAVFAPNQYNHIVLYLSLLAADCIISPGNPAYTENEFEHQIITSQATALVTVPALLPVLLKIWDKIGKPRSRVFLFGDQPVQDCRPFSAIQGTRPIQRRTRDRSEDVAFICYSSGTTGLAKGVMLSHKNFIAQSLFFLSAGIDLNERQCLLGFLPFFHIYGLNTLVLTAYYMVAPVVVMGRFDLELMCQLIEKYKVTTAAVVPPVAVLLAKSPVVTRYDLGSIRNLVCGAAPLSKEHIQSLHKRIPLDVRQGYGMTETTSAIVIQTPEHTAPGSIGVLVPNTECKIVNEQGEGDDQEGELLFRGPSIMKGYLNNPKANAETFTSDGWMRTGDIGKFDSATGEFYVVDRIKELIKYKGFQVAPAELEGILMDMDIISDCCVVGVYDENQATELPRAYVVVQAGIEQSQKTARLIEDYVAQHVANHKKLRGGVRFIDAVPKNASGKILRKNVKEWIKLEQKQVKARL